MNGSGQPGTAHAWKVGASRELLTRPLYHTLNRSSGFPGELFFDTPQAHIEQMMGKALDAAFVAPIDLAQNSSDMILYPEIGAVSSGESGAARLYMRSDLQKIESVAVGNESTTTIVLSRIILGEKYESEPSIVPMLGTIEQMLAKADCALVSDRHLVGVTSKLPYIDIVDEWEDLTDLPFVHSVCIARSESFSPELHSLLMASQRSGSAALGAVAQELVKETSNSAEELEQYLSNFSYGLDDPARQSLEEFFRMAFYYGILGDVPEITFG